MTDLGKEGGWSKDGGSLYDFELKVIKWVQSEVKKYVFIKIQLNVLGIENWWRGHLQNIENDMKWPLSIDVDIQLHFDPLSVLLAKFRRKEVGLSLFCRMLRKKFQLHR